MNLDQLRAQRNELADKMSAIAELDAQSITDQQAAEFDQAEAEFKKLDAQIQRAESVERTKARDYQGIIEDLLNKLSEMQEFSNDSQRRLIHDLNIWLVARFESTKD